MMTSGSPRAAQAPEPAVRGRVRVRSIGASHDDRRWTRFEEIRPRQTSRCVPENDKGSRRSAATPCDSWSGKRDSNPRPSAWECAGRGGRGANLVKSRGPLRCLDEVACGCDGKRLPKVCPRPEVKAARRQAIRKVSKRG